MSDLRFSLRGYASGGYGGTCVSCGTKFVGDKRAFQCLICAAVNASKRIAELEAQLADALYALDRISDSDVSTSTGHLRDIANEVIHNTPVPEGE